MVKTTSTDWKMTLGLIIHHSKQYKCWALSNFLVLCYSLETRLSDVLFVYTFRDISWVQDVIVALWSAEQSQRAHMSKHIWHYKVSPLNMKPLIDVTAFHSPSCQAAHTQEHFCQQIIHPCFTNVTICLIVLRSVLVVTALNLKVGS